MATSSTTVITKKGENLYKIGGKKMVTVSRWRDVTLVHIREYDGEEPNVFPTKRGLVLTPAEFKALVALTKTVQHDVEQKNIWAQLFNATATTATATTILHPSRGREVGGLNNTWTPRS